MDSLQTIDDFVQMFVLILFTLERLHEHSENGQTVFVSARLLNGLELGAIPVHKVNLVQF